MTVALLWAAMKVIRIAKRSVSMHKNPAYILYSDPKALNKWGFLYVQFRATAYYFILPIMVYIVIKAVFIAFAQEAPTVQGIALVIIEAIALIAVSILRPWMDKKTNVFNIAIAVVNFLNGIFLLVFTNVFNQPVRDIRPSYIAVTDMSSGNCNRSHGCDILRLQCFLRSYTVDHGPRIVDLGNCLKES